MGAWAGQIALSALHGTESLADGSGGVALRRLPDANVGHRTAWAWLQQLRSVMIRRGREQVRGRGDVEEPDIGGKQAGAAFRPTVGNSSIGSWNKLGQ